MKWNKRAASSKNIYKKFYQLQAEFRNQCCTVAKNVKQIWADLGAIRKSNSFHPKESLSNVGHWPIYANIFIIIIPLFTNNWVDVTEVVKWSILKISRIQVQIAWVLNW